MSVWFVYIQLHQLLFTGSGGSQVLLLTSVTENLGGEDHFIAQVILVEIQLNSS